MSLSINNNHDCQQHLIGLPECLESLDDDDPNIKPYDLGVLSSFESRLVQALREHPDRVEYWVKKGRIDKNHKYLLQLYSHFFGLLAEHGIEYWLEFGSLLGYIRHHGIFPWEYDMDIAIESKELSKLEVVAKKLEEEGSEWGFKWHCYDDWEGTAPDYVFYNKNYPGTFCDVTLYNREGPLLKCYRPEWNYDDYIYELVFPLRKVVIFGQPALIPNEPTKVLNYHEKLLGQITIGTVTNVNRVKWMQYDPIPFLLCQLYNPKHTEKLCTYALKSVPKNKKLLQKSNENHSCNSTESSDEGGKMEETNNNSVISKTLSDNPNEAEQKNKQDEKQNIIDALIQITPLNIQKLNITVENAQEEEKEIQQTEQKAFQQFETINTPTLFTNLSGITTFIVAPPEYENDILTLTKEKNYNLIHELLYLNEHKLWGKMYQTLLSKGDSLYVPQGYVVSKTQFGINSLQIQKYSIIKQK